jgi:hypothetical protein
MNSWGNFEVTGADFEQCPPDGGGKIQSVPGDVQFSARQVSRHVFSSGHFYRAVSFEIIEIYGCSN